MVTVRRRYGFLVLISGIGYVLSFGNQLLVSYLFGTSGQLDAYWLTLAIAGFAVFYVHPFREALVPDAHRASAISSEKCSEVLVAGMAVLALLAMISLVGFAALGGLAGTFAQSGSKTDANGLLAWFVPFILLFGFSETCNAVLISLDLAVWQAVARLAAAVASLSCLAEFGPVLGIRGLVLSLVAGQMVVFAVSLAALARQGIRLKWAGFSVLKEGRFAAMFVSLLLNYAMAQAYSLYERWAMSSFSPGALSGYQYATSLVNVVISLLAVPLANVAWPKFLACRLEAGERQSADLLRRACIPLFLLLLPICTFAFRFASQISGILFARGAFDAVSLASTSSALALTIFSAIPIGMSALLTRALMAEGRSRNVAAIGFATTIAGAAIISGGLVTNSLATVRLHWLLANSFGLLVGLGMFFGDQLRGWRQSFGATLWVARWAVAAVAAAWVLPSPPESLSNKLVLSAVLGAEALLYVILFVGIALLMRAISWSDIKRVVPHLTKA
jgi:putative peptidoglycan lipid II flippase